MKYSANVTYVIIHIPIHNYRMSLTHWCAFAHPLPPHVYKNGHSPASIPNIQSSLPIEVH